MVLCFVFVVTGFLFLVFRGFGCFVVWFGGLVGLFRLWFVPVRFSLCGLWATGICYFCLVAWLVIGVWVVELRFVIL